MPDQPTDRLREAILTPEEVDIEALKAAAAAAGSEISPERAMTLVRLAHHQTVQPELLADALERMNTPGEVLTSNDEQLIAVLACEALILNFARVRYTRGELPALAIPCARHAGWTPVHPDLESHAASYRASRSIAVRERPFGMPEPKRPADAAADWEPTPSEEYRVLRDVVAMDRLATREREALAWWLLSQTRPRHPVSVALELSASIHFMPEPLAATEMLRAKLDMPTVEGPPVTIDVPPELSELCPDIVNPRAEVADAEEFEEAVRCLSQLMLLRAYNGLVKR
jgi:hypothetical protein